MPTLLNARVGLSGIDVLSHTQDQPISREGVDVVIVAVVNSDEHVVWSGRLHGVRVHGDEEVASDCSVGCAHGELVPQRFPRVELHTRRTPVPCWRSTVYRNRCAVRLNRNPEVPVYSRIGTSSFGDNDDTVTPEEVA